MDNKHYLAAFIVSGFTGIGCKMILAVNAGSSEEERRILDNIPLASVISGLLFLSALNLLPYEASAGLRPELRERGNEDPTEGPEEEEDR